MYLAPGFPIPPNSDYKGYHAYIDECLPTESPYLYGLHPNAEIEFLTTNSDNLFKTVFEMQPRDASAGAGGGATKEERIKQVCYSKAKSLKDYYIISLRFLVMEAINLTKWRRGECCFLDEISCKLGILIVCLV